MLLDLKIKVRRALFVHSGELLTAGNGASPRLPLFPAGSSFSLSPILSQPSDLRYTARIRTYHVVGLFIKETL
jgi:hypothetical protein